VIGREPCEDLMSAVKDGCNHRVPKPRCHITKLSNKRTRDET
jgi:hypothetical protein